MITKERLEELIKQGATIYEAKYHDTTPVDLSKREVRCISSRYNVVAFEPKPNERWLNHKYFDKLFETKEEAEWYLEFGNIERVERLNLPTWEEIITNNKYNYYGTSYFEFGDDYRLIVKLPNEDDDCEFIGIDINGNCELYNWEEATKENYIEACKMAKKLFLGEEV